MSNDVLAAITDCMTDEENVERYTSLSADNIKQHLEDAKRDLFKWGEGITDFEENWKSFLVVGDYAAAVEQNAYYNGFKAGMKLMREVFQ